MPGRWLTARPILHPRPRSDSVRRATRSRRCQKIRHVAQSFVVPFRAASACVTWFLCFSAADQSLSSAAGCVCVCVCVCHVGCASASSAPLSTGRCLRVTYCLYLSRRAVVGRVASSRNRPCAARQPVARRRVSLLCCLFSSPPRPFVVSCRLFTSFVSPLPLLNSCEPNFASRWCARGHSLVDQYVWCAQPRCCVYMLVQTACCLWLYLSIRSWSLSPRTLIAESCHIPLLRSVQCQSLAVGSRPSRGCRRRHRGAACVTLPHISNQF